MTNHRQKIYLISKPILLNDISLEKKYCKLTFFGISVTDSDILMTNYSICLYVKYTRKSSFLGDF